MPSLFEPETALVITGRLHQLEADSQQLWGKMNAAQMMAHLRKLLEVATGDKQERPTFFAKLLAPWIKTVMLSDKPFRPNLPTGPSFIVRDNRNFATEKEKLLQLYQRFIQEGAVAAEGRMHPLIGKMSADEWGFSQWKHFDHHLRQFGV
ncbi:hypothetical protein F5148DRAFT_1290899 [Russula earlei]|uniref:Uncharacterized protein n=1 Tax=Russula earlei TaxID=71964 RepID=A0ACC0TV47_9AGAM|nr:hypothetical protein F5148DRAFT_1290899 [Russula earlei]